MTKPNNDSKPIRKANDIFEIESKFHRALGDGVKAGAYMQQLILSVVDSRDTTVLVKAIQRASENKADHQAVSTLRAVIGQVWPKAKVTKNKSNTVSILIKGIKEDSEALERLALAVSSEYSIRGVAFKKAIMPESETVTLTPDTARDKLHKYMAKIAKELGVPYDQVKAMATANATEVA